MVLHGGSLGYVPDSRVRFSAVSESTKTLKLSTCSRSRLAQSAVARSKMSQAHVSPTSWVMPLLEPPSDRVMMR